jgi:hypothetical protein
MFEFLPQWVIYLGIVLLILAAIRAGIWVAE